MFPGLRARVSLGRGGHRHLPVSAKRHRRDVTVSGVDLFSINNSNRDSARPPRFPQNTSWVEKVFVILTNGEI